MQKSKSLILISLIASLLSSSLSLKAQTTDALSTYSPYSMFGVGDIVKQGNVINYSMGGIGIGLRNNRYINYLNPAAITERDTLAFMLDFGVTQKNNYIKDSNAKSAYNIFNMYNFVFTTPIYKKSALVIGVTPFSDTGYKLETTETDEDIVAEIGDVKYRKYGTGSINQLFVGAGLVFAKYFSFGAQAIYYFGTVDRYSNVLYNSATSFRSILTGWNYEVSSFSGKLGLQYSQPFKNRTTLTIGATYRFGSNLKGRVYRYAYSVSSNATDTILFNQNNNAMLSIASEIGVGASFKQRDKWSFGFDYVLQDWKNSNFAKFQGIDFQPSLAQSFKAGFEFVPNRYDIRYYLKRVTYRGGAYYDRSYISLNGNQITSVGITLGATFPIFRWYNSISVGIDMGQRGYLKDSMVRERYINFMIGVNLHDIWFQKYRYE